MAEEYIQGALAFRLRTLLRTKNAYKISRDWGFGEASNLEFSPILTNSGVEGGFFVSNRKEGMK